MQSCLSHIILWSFDVIVFSEIQCNVTFLSELECMLAWMSLIACMYVWEIWEWTLCLPPILYVNFAQVGAQGNWLTMAKPNSYGIKNSNLVDHLGYNYVVI
jgi:hypothetical protein